MGARNSHCLAEYVVDEMTARGWKTDDVAVRMKTPHGAAMDLFCLDLLLAVQDDKLLIDKQMFDGLSRAFGISASMLSNLHDLWLASPNRLPFDCPESVFGPSSRRSMMRVVR
jgi:hypothetical protein